MNAEIKREWIERLRSGEYKQGMFALNRGQTFCCLGVLCEIAVEKGVAIRVDTDRTFIRYRDNDGNTCNATLPRALQTWSGLGADDIGELVLQNDRKKRSFKEIADYIESGL